MITHVVLFRFRDPADVASATDRLRALGGVVPALRSIRVGTNGNTGPNAFDVVLVTEHDNADQLAAYQADPAHRAVADWLASRVTDRAVVDSADFGVG